MQNFLDFEREENAEKLPREQEWKDNRYGMWEQNLEILNTAIQPNSNNATKTVDGSILTNKRPTQHRKKESKKRQVPPV